MKKMRLFAGILLFGSIWGFSEIIIGSTLSDIGLPAGAIMTGFFVITILVISRMTFKQPGMQLGIGLVAGILRMFNPFVGCHLCSAIAIMAEGAIFEIIWYNISFDFKELKTKTMQGSIGIISAYLIFIGGYIITQILTPIVDGTGFYLQNFIIFLPRILARGVLPALIGAVMIPIVIYTRKFDLTIKDKLYYPTTLGISIFCWIFVLANWFILKF